MLKQYHRFNITFFIVLIYSLLNLSIQYLSFFHRRYACYLVMLKKKVPDERKIDITMFFGMLNSSWFKESCFCGLLQKPNFFC